MSKIQVKQVLFATIKGYYAKHFYSLYLGGVFDEEFEVGE